MSAGRCICARRTPCPDGLEEPTPCARGLQPKPTVALALCASRLRLRGRAEAEAPRRPRRRRRRRPAIMGSYLSSYLGTAKATQPLPARERRAPRPRPALSTSRLPGPDHCPIVCIRPVLSDSPPPAAPPRRRDHDAARRALLPEAWRRVPSGPPLRTTVGLDLLGRRRSYPWAARNPRRSRSLVTIKIAPPQHRGSIYCCPPAQEQPDPCAKETVLRALSQCKKGKRKFDGPLWFESPDPKRSSQSPERRLSAFQPVWRDGVVRSFVPKTGPLRSSSSQCNRD
ncbi:POM121-like protein 12 [Camelus dromedarius]|uniref:POM121-like protein 12 n=1 Tax=Camelus dromedarius TaxID=9838 RepID=UPI00311A0845